MAVYEGIDMVVCQGCQAKILLSLDDPDRDVACKDAELPLDCNEAEQVVKGKGYKSWEYGPWNDDEEPIWD